MPQAQADESKASGPIGAEAPEAVRAGGESAGAAVGPAVGTGEKSRRSTLSIRVLLTASMVAPVVLVCVALVVLLTLTSRRLQEDLAAQATGAAVSEVRAELRHVAAQATRVSDAFSMRVASGELSTDNLRTWHSPMFAELQTTREVASICFGGVGGDAVWLLRGEGGRLEFGQVARDGGGMAREFLLDEQGQLQGGLLREYAYDPRERPWYRVAMEAAGSGGLARAAPGAWTPIYNWFQGRSTEALMGTGLARVLRDEQGAALGVLVIDVTLGGLSSALKALPLVESQEHAGRVAIIDSAGKLIAASHGTVVGTDGQPKPLSQSEDAMIALCGQAVARSGVDRLDVSGAGKVRVVVQTVSEGAARRLGRDAISGLDWRLVVAVPEAMFGADAAAARARAILLGVACTLLAVLGAAMLARGLAKPMLQITQRLRSLGKGDFDSRLALSGASELVEVSTALNDVAQGMRERLELERALGVARDVQLALLPQKTREFHRLEVLGRARYCDQTGGDYFDYLDVSKASQTATMLAIGDVMGHGIGAALMMATARAALRARIDDATDLGELLTRANRLLAQSTQTSQFVTMLLLTIDPATERARWASAGHDLPMIFDPVLDRFFPIDGGDVPLGIFEETTYAEYSGEGLARPGVVFLLGTDGIWETVSPKSGALWHGTPEGARSRSRATTSD
ncbi:MAG: SpoIIE family protein phosphatase [Planctomycetota bacterium]|nr:SpoIIE family protein phosphatase [Planctomycetota bacterium]